MSWSPLSFLGAAAGELDPLLAALVIVLATAKVSGALAERVGQPAVLGELMIGVVLGNLSLLGWGGLEFLENQQGLKILAELGVIVLLFEVGLDSNLSELMKVGIASTVVAVVGVVAPMLLGSTVSWLILPDRSIYVHVFIGATLCATSVGITARVLQDLGKTRTEEARVILGAAVIDDVLGLIVLAVVAGTIAAAGGGESLSAGSVALIIGKSMFFLAASLALGLALAPRLFRVAKKLRTRGTFLALSLTGCFGLAWASAAMGLAPIIGAFAAGLILAGVPWKEIEPEQTIEDLVHPISGFLVPVFFVQMGLQVDLRTMADLSVLAIGGALTLTAILGKQLCSLGVVGSKADRITVGIGMVPRGEVGLIFANVGLTLTIAGLPVVDSGLYSAIVLMVVITTMVAPPGLKWALARSERRSRPGTPKQAPPQPKEARPGIL